MRTHTHAHTRARTHTHTQVVEHFRLLGRSLGKTLQDNRLMDLPINYTFYRYVYMCNIKFTSLTAVRSNACSLLHLLEFNEQWVVQHE